MQVQSQGEDGQDDGGDVAQGHLALRRATVGAPPPKGEHTATPRGLGVQPLGPAVGMGTRQRAPDPKAVPQQEPSDASRPPPKCTRTPPKCTRIPKDAPLKM